MTAICELCGEPMPVGEEAFKYHGYSGPCPKPMKPLPEWKTGAVVEYIFRYMVGDDGTFWIDVLVNREPYAHVGPFDTAAERQRAHDDMLEDMLRSMGAKDVPGGTQ